MNGTTSVPRYEPDRLFLDTIGGKPVRVVYDGWRQRDRILRYTGPCVVCDRKTWSFDDGENDPRGMLGDNALWVSTFEVDGKDVDVRTCAICANDEPSYRLAERALHMRGSVAVAPWRHDDNGRWLR